MKQSAHVKADGLFAGFTYCGKCGLLYLKNEASKKEVKKACPGSE
jgi:hypothetical protein